ncbi:hypothetical protein [Streptomyces sp. NPDC002588]|uniref:hypothetical protein n=1 Tax=Streptomyces sp. NPDC002588 TaxID=3154419 RepID=UPI00332F2C2A
MQRTKTVAVALTATAALLTAAGTATADDTTPTPSATVQGDGAQVLCKRAPKIDKRIDRALNRLNGPADARGSIARLEQRVAAARTAGHDQIETYLNDRLTFRKSLVPMLQQRKKDLAQVTTWCAANNDGASA